MREILSDGVNSIAHVGAGIVLGKDGLLPMLAYQWILKRDENSAVDTAEYLLGQLIRSFVAANNRTMVD